MQTEPTVQQKFNIKATVTDAEATLNTSSRWGDYEIDVKENSTKYLRNTRNDADFEVNSGIQGMILKQQTAEIRHAPYGRNVAAGV